MPVKHQLVYNSRQVVVGWGLDCLLYSHWHGCPAILTKSQHPHPFDFLSDDERVLQELAGPKKIDLYNFLIFNLSMNGLLPFGGQVVAAEKLSDGLRVVLENSLVCFFRTDKVVDKVPAIAKDKKVVLDWINVKSGLKHDHDRIEDTSDVAKCIHFYPSKRIDGSVASNLKDLVVVSHMSEEQILDSNYSPFYVRMKAAQIMKEHGIRGPKNGMSPSGQKYRPLVLETSKREVYPLVRSKLEVPETASISQVAYL